jgi:hypothetical protein
VPFLIVKLVSVSKKLEEPKVWLVRWVYSLTSLMNECFARFLLLFLGSPWV